MQIAVMLCEVDAKDCVLKSGCELGMLRVLMMESTVDDAVSVPGHGL